MADAKDGVLGSAAFSTAPVSFSFSRTSSRRRLADSGDGAGAASEEKDFLKSVEGRELHSVKPSETPKELVIPLIQNGCQRRQPPTQTQELYTNDPTMDGILSQAVKELIEESKKSLEERENAGVDPTLAIPMIQKGYTSSEHGKDGEPQAETLPEEANYEAVPVEAYGLAMLRGMGWKPGEGIGRTFNQVVKPRVNSLRPKGLGLGACLAELQSLAPAGPHRPPKPNEECEKDKEEHPKELVPGGAVVMLSGPHRGLYGKVEGLDPDNARAMVRLATKSHMVTVSEYCLRPVSQQEFDKNTNSGKLLLRDNEDGYILGGCQSDIKLLNHSNTVGVGWVMNEGFLKESQKIEGNGQADRSYPRQLNGKGSQDLDLWEDSHRKRKHLPDRQSGPSAKGNAVTASRTQHWLHRDLRVRFVDKQHKGGHYYNTKMTIEDVLSPGICVCRTDEGRILEGLKEDMLETLVPKVEGHRVMVVLGPQAGKVGRLLGRDQARSRAMVQLQRENQLVELHYDAVCQYMGPSDAEDD